MGRQSRHKAKKNIQKPNDHAAAHTPQTCRRNLKIRMQPMRICCGGIGNGGNQMLQLILSKAVEKKTRHDEIKYCSWWLPC